jgi:hypothetical protein
MPQFKKGSKVGWKWMGRIIEGTVDEVFLESVSKTIKEKKITRHGSVEKPAYLVISEAGNKALKLESELLASSPKVKSSSSPKMFKS